MLKFYKIIKKSLFTLALCLVGVGSAVGADSTTDVSKFNPSGVQVEAENPSGGFIPDWSKGKTCFFSLYKSSMYGSASSSYSLSCSSLGTVNYSLNGVTSYAFIEFIAKENLYLYSAIARTGILNYNYGIPMVKLNGITTTDYYTYLLSPVASGSYIKKGDTVYVGAIYSSVDTAGTISGEIVVYPLID